mmetsp:Transcript_11614/g.36901  ORF Transcript_11614/g.36901 Transcript_11614/m.36901 type:complete len:308 (+) Transcript_11614:2-925(+)
MAAATAAATATGTATTVTGTSVTSTSSTSATSTTATATATSSTTSVTTRTDTTTATTTTSTSTTSETSTTTTSTFSSTTTTSTSATTTTSTLTTTTATSTTTTTTTEEPIELAMSCAHQEAAFNPIDMLGQVPVQVGNVAECQDRCASVDGCAHYTYWVPQRVCHLQDATAVRSSLKTPGFISGPPACKESEIKGFVKALKSKLPFGLSGVVPPMQRKFARVKEGLHDAVGRVGFGAPAGVLAGLCALAIASMGVAGVRALKRRRPQAVRPGRQLLSCTDSSDSDDGRVPGGGGANDYVLVQDARSQ